MALTDAKIRAAKPTDKAYKLTDGAGMFLLVHPNGSRYWRLRYRILGKEKTLALGVYPEVSLSEARTKREEARKLISEGVDPCEQKRAKKVVPDLQLSFGNDSNLLIVFYVQIMPDDFVMQLHR
ncbi:Arm DNA-binding domain-containing protein, partial [Escherichia coli]